MTENVQGAPHSSPSARDHSVEDHSVQILILESNSAFTNQILEILRNKAGLKLFSVEVAANLKDAFIQIESQHPDIVMMDTSPEDDPDFSHFNRLFLYGPQAPIIVMLDDYYKDAAPQLIQRGAHHYLLMSQIREETLPGYLLRVMERHASQKAIKESEERFRLLIEHASDVITTLNPSGSITFTGPSTKRILDYPHSELIGRNWLDFIHRDDRAVFLDHFEKAFGEGGQLKSIPFRFRHREGHWIHMEGKGRIVSDISGQPICVLNSHDISHRVRLEDKLRALSLRDELTGLHNRRSFVEFFDQQLKAGRRSKKQGIYVLFIDLDGFKWINDNLSHKEGDRALIDASHILKTTFRQADIIARLGGDEFVVLLTDGFEQANTESLKKRLSSGLGEWNARETKPYKLAMSVGVIYHDFKKNRTLEDLLFEADELMFKQKKDKKRGAPPESQADLVQSGESKLD